MDRIQKGYQEDPTFYLQHDYISKDGYYFKGNQIVVPDEANLRRDVIDSVHSPSYAAHGGRDKTLELVKRTFYWPKMDQDVADFVKKCFKCQTNKSSNQKKAGLLQPVEIPNQFWECVTTDLITQLPPTSSGYDAVVVFVDKLSKMVKVEPCHSDIDATTFAKLFHKVVIRSHGWPRKLLSDRDVRFTGHFWTEVTKSLGIHQALSTSFHPETDGQTEIANRVLEDALRSYTNPYHDDWDEYLYQVEFAMNNSYHETIKMTPFYAIYGEHPFTPLTLTTRVLHRFSGNCGFSRKSYQTTCGMEIRYPQVFLTFPPKLRFFPQVLKKSCGTKFSLYKAFLYSRPRFFSSFSLQSILYSRPQFF